MRNKKQFISYKGYRIYKKQYEDITYDVKTRKFGTKEENIALINMFEFANNDFTNERATKMELGKIFLNKIFDFPKPVSLIKALVKYSNKNVTVLDFFAGSGTTGQAVMELNREDNGNRRFILITNNERNGYDTKTNPEYGIARAITRERLFRVINGKGSNDEVIKWELPKELQKDNQNYLSENSVNYLKVKTIHKVNGEFEEIDNIKELYSKEFNAQDFSIMELENG